MPTNLPRQIVMIGFDPRTYSAARRVLELPGYLETSNDAYVSGKRRLLDAQRPKKNQKETNIVAVVTNLFTPSKHLTGSTDSGRGIELALMATEISVDLKIWIVCTKTIPEKQKWIGDAARAGSGLWTYQPSPDWNQLRTDLGAFMHANRQ